MTTMKGEPRIGRRELLLGAGAGMGGLALATMAAPAAASAQSTDQVDGLTGGWLITHASPGGPSSQAVLTFAAGGALASIDINPPGPPQLGTWEPRPSNGFEAQFWSSALDPTGAFAGTLRVHIHGSFTDDGHISGRFSFVIFDPTGKQVFSGQGTFSGGRIIP